VVPAGAEPNPAASIPPVDDLKYQPNPTGADKPLDRTASPELMTVKLRYKEPDGGTSKLISQPFTDRGLEFTQAAPDLKFAAAVAELGMILRDSEYKGNASLGAIAVWAQEGKGEDPNGYRAAFLELLRKVRALKKD
jgi:Ca-activated chloride channel family protein